MPRTVRTLVCLIEGRGGPPLPQHGGHWPQRHLFLGPCQLNSPQEVAVGRKGFHTEVPGRKGPAPFLGD